MEVRSCHGNRAELAWRAAPANGAKIREYSLEFNTSDAPDVWYPYYERIPGDRHEFFVDLAPYGTYTFRLLARNDIGDSQPSDVTRRSCTTPPDKPDRNPKQVVTRTHKKGYLVIEWTVGRTSLSVIGTHTFTPTSKHIHTHQNTFTHILHTSSPNHKILDCYTSSDNTNPHLYTLPLLLTKGQRSR